MPVLFEAHRSVNPFFRMTLFGVAIPVPTVLMRVFRFPLKGVPYGGGLIERAASQSKGIEEEMEGVADGELT